MGRALLHHDREVQSQASLSWLGGRCGATAQGCLRATVSAIMETPSRIKGRARREAVMAKAYVKIWVDGGKEEAVKESLLANDSVMVADITAGEQDLIALIEAKTYDDLLKTVIRKIRKIPGVQKTSTNLVLE
jgi:DNA-binding Lrp family transcriptional regulator